MTVDEVGEEEDSIIEPDILELQEESLREETSSAGLTEAKLDSNPTASLDTQRGDSQDGSPPREDPEDAPAATSPKETKEDKSTPEPHSSDLNHFPNQEFKVALEETCSTPDMSGADAPKSAPDCLSNHNGECDSAKPTEPNRDVDTGKSGHVTENLHKDTQIKEDGQCQRKGWFSLLFLLLNCSQPGNRVED